MRCHLCVASSSQALADLRTPLATRRLLHMQRYCAHGLKVLSHVWRWCSEALLNRVKKYCQVIEECCWWIFYEGFFQRLILDLWWWGCLPSSHPVWNQTDVFFIEINFVFWFVVCWCRQYFTRTAACLKIRICRAVDKETGVTSGQGNKSFTLRHKRDLLTVKR